MRNHNPTAGLGSRERQIMDVVFRLGSASVSDVHRRLADAPTYSTVRKMLALLEQKGHVRHRVHGSRYIYEPTLRRESARRSALKHLIDTFFGGSEHELVATLVRDMDVSDDELADLGRLIAAAQRASRPGAT